MSHLSVFHFLALLFCFVPIVHGDINAIEHKGKLQPSKQVQFLQDSAADLSISEALNSTDWSFSESSSFGYTDAVYWFRFTLNNTGDQNLMRLMEISYPVLDEIQVRVFDKSTMVLEHEWDLGDKNVFAERPLNHRNFVMPFELSAGAEQLWVLRVKTSSSMQVPISIWPERHFFVEDQNSLMGMGLYYGIMLIMVLYNLFVFLSVREENYLYYVLYVASMAGFLASLQGLSFQYAWPEATSWNDNSILVFLSSVIIFGSIFTRNFLFLSEGAPLLNRLFGLTAIIAGIILLLANFVPYGFLIRLLIVVGVVGIGLSIYSGLRRWSEGYTSARYYTIAWSSMLLGGAILAMNKVNLIPRSVFSENAIQIGSALEVILLSFALADRLNQEKKVRYEAQISALEHERVARNAQAEALEQERCARAAQEKALEHERQAREAQDKALKIQKKANETLEKKVKERTTELESVNKKLELLSITDALTEVRNRRYFDQVLEREFNRAHREREMLTILMLDIDHFKHVNDEYGHQIGDEALRRVSQILKKNIHRNTDLIARYGGEEFAIILPNTSVEGGYFVADCLRKYIEEQTVVSGDVELKLTVSIGVMGDEPSNTDNPDRWVKEADDALYKAKEGGRNRVVIASGCEHLLSDSNKE